MEPAPWCSRAVRGAAGQLRGPRRCAGRKHRPGRPAYRAAAAVPGAAGSGGGHREHHRQHYPVGHRQRLGGAGSPDRERQLYRAVSGIPRSQRHARGRAGDARAGLILAAAQRAAGAAHPVRQQCVFQAVSGILQSPRGGRAGGGAQRLCQHRLQLEQHAPVAHQRQSRFLGAGQPEHLCRHEPERRRQRERDGRRSARSAAPAGHRPSAGRKRRRCGKRDREFPVRRSYRLCL